MNKSAEYLIRLAVEEALTKQAGGLSGSPFNAILNGWGRALQAGRTAVNRAVPAALSQNVGEAASKTVGGLGKAVSGLASGSATPAGTLAKMEAERKLRDAARAAAQKKI